MSKSILHSAITAAMAISIAACSSGSDVAGIGGSGITPTGGVISSGTITGFGSIIVNGVKFETSTSTFSIDDSPSGSQDDLAVGMRVTVNGTVNSDGVNGTATSVIFDDQLQGPVSGLTENLDQTLKTFSVLGITVIASDVDTSYDVSGSNPANPAAYSYVDLVNGNNIEISGFFNANGELEATRVELKDVTFSTSNIIEIKGSITSVIGTDIIVNGVNVDASNPSEGIDNLPNGLEVGAFVEVKGTCDSSICDPVRATKVEGENQGFDDDGDTEIEGLITDFNSISDFKVAGLPVNATGARLEPTTLVPANDIKVEVEGNVVGGVLNANVIKLRGGDNKVSGRVATPVVNNQFEVEVDRGDNETVTVIVTSETELEDDVNENKFFSIGDLAVDDFVEVRGFTDASNDVTATQVKVSDPDDFIVQGVITDLTGDANSGSVTVLGVTMPYVGGADPTDFEDQNDNGVNFITFSGLITTGQTMVKVKDKETASNNTPIGVADEIEIED